MGNHGVGELLSGLQGEKALYHPDSFEDLPENIRK